MGFHDWSGDTIHRKCQSDWTNFHICYGISGLFECWNVTFEWNIIVSTFLFSIARFPFRIGCHHQILLFLFLALINHSYLKRVWPLTIQLPASIILNLTHNFTLVNSVTKHLLVIVCFCFWFDEFFVDWYFFTILCSLTLSFVLKQHHILRHHHEKLCGIEHFTKIAYNHKIRFENDVKLVGNDYFYVSWRSNCK